MPHHVIVPPNITRAIGAFGLGRTALLNLLFRLRLDLEGEAEEHRRHRDPNDSSLFWYEVIVIDQGRNRHFRFAVDDGRASGYRFLEAVQEAT